MKFTETALSGAFLIELEPSRDERGFFVRNWTRDEFASHGLDCDLDECAISFNRRAGTLRGLHYQVAPYGQSKLVSCTAGAIFDVIVDLRADSPTRGKWIAAELSAENQRMLYAPRGFAHGFQTLLDNTLVSYQISGRYSPSHSRVIRWDDAEFAIKWPALPTVLSERDRGAKA